MNPREISIKENLTVGVLKRYLEGLHEDVGVVIVVRKGCCNKITNNVEMCYTPMSFVEEISSNHIGTVTRPTLVLDALVDVKCEDCPDIPSRKPELPKE